MLCHPRILIALAVLWLTGCAQIDYVIRLNTSVKNAYVMYSLQRQDLGPPSSEHVQVVDSEIGREAFLEDLSHYVSTKYRREAIYAIGWFGDDRSIGLIAKALDDPDPEVQRIALASFSHLNKRTFKDVEEARAWWRGRVATSPAP